MNVSNSIPMPIYLSLSFIFWLKFENIMICVALSLSSYPNSLYLICNYLVMCSRSIDFNYLSVIILCIIVWFLFFLYCIFVTSGHMQQKWMNFYFYTFRRFFNDLEMLLLTIQVVRSLCISFSSLIIEFFFSF